MSNKCATIKNLDKVLQHVDQLYNSKCINWKGKTSDTNEYYSEVIAKKLLTPNRYKLITQIKQIDRKNYKIESHKKIIISKTRRKEEIFAKKLHSIELNKLGKVIDYQIPLKSKRSDKAGKIDLITCKEDAAYIVEVKYLGNTENLLRAVLEIWTYYNQLNKKNFLKSFKEYKNKKCRDIKKAVLLAKGSTAYKEATELNERPALKKLIQKLDVKIFLFEYRVTKIL